MCVAFNGRVKECVLRCDVSLHMYCSTLYVERRPYIDERSTVIRYACISGLALSTLFRAAEMPKQKDGDAQKESNTPDASSGSCLRVSEHAALHLHVDRLVAANSAVS